MPAAPHPRMHGLTHVPGGPDPIPGLVLGGAGGLADLILAHPFLAAFWKLNEPSGDVAADSGPDSYDMDSGSYSPPTWGQPAGPPGETSALFGAGLGESTTAVPALTGDLTLEVWAKRTADGGVDLVGQGNPVATGGPGTGLVWLPSSGSYSAGVWIGHSSGPHNVLSDAPLSIGPWYHLAAVRETHIWTLYLDGAAQAASYDDSGTSYTATTGAWIGNDPATDRGFVGCLSYAAVYNGALTAAEILAHYEAATSDELAGGGSAWFHGSGTPPSFLGADGSYYLDTSTGDIWFNTAGTWAKIWDEP